jgi:ferredoxin
MADNSDKVEENIKGVFYVDSSCIDCDKCREVAPDNFNRSDENEYSYVDKQPENEEEYTQCVDAMCECPVDAIGEDGEE